MPFWLSERPHAPPFLTITYLSPLWNLAPAMGPFFLTVENSIGEYSAAAEENPILRKSRKVGGQPRFE
jgi:hypothetical protein